MTLHHMITLFNEWLTILCVFPGILLIGCFLTIRLRGIQIRKLFRSIQYLMYQSQETKGNITPFQAISAVLAGNLGTGNISGMAVALATGGPGSLVWMWVMAFLGAAIQYASCFLGARYRTQSSLGEYVGGPMYYLYYGLQSKWLGILFCLFTIFGAFTVGNLAQIHSISLPMASFGFQPFSISLVMAGFVAFVLLGGIERFAKVAGTVVPFKAVLYLGCAIVIIVLNFDKVPEAFSLIFKEAFSLQATAGGILGFAMLKSVATGFERGIFATDAGTGIVPILQASAKTEHPVVTGILSLLSPAIVMVVCTATALVVLVTGAWQTGLESTNMVTYAFETGLSSSLGKYVVIFSLLLFAYTTIIAWAFCMDKSVEFLFGKKAVPWVRFVFIAIVPCGTLLHVSTVWALADVCISLMVITNLIAVIGLRKEIISETQAFLGCEKTNRQEAFRTLQDDSDITSPDYVK